MNKLGGRKFGFSVYAFTVASVLVYAGVIDPTVYQFVATAIITGYLVANVSQKVFVP